MSNEAKKVLYEQAKVAGLEVDRRWSVETLAEKVQEAQEAQSEHEAVAIKGSSNTWVYPIRDCFLGTEKKPAGTAFKAPKELYANWKAAGAARMADDDEIAKAS